MKWRSTYNHPQQWKFVIEYELLFDSIEKEDFPAYYLIVSDKDGNDMYNYMQEELDATLEQAQMKFGVPEDSWIKTE